MADYTLSDYHERSKHRLTRYAPGPGGLDWANQPDPFRYYQHDCGHAIAAVSYAAIIGKYADRDIDFADVALIWLADRIGARHILTVDFTDFEIYRLKGRKRFQLVRWFD